jgi:hypothetical protein
MARWVVERSPSVNGPEAGRQNTCFRVHPEGEPDLWVVRTNPALPSAAQEEFARLIAELLSDLL